MDQAALLEYLQEARDLAQGEYGGNPKRDAVDELHRRSIHIGAALDAVLPGMSKSFRSSLGAETWLIVRRYLDQGIYALQDGIRVQTAIGPSPAPTLRADALHPTVWEACASLWRSQHRREAINAAAVAVNAALQNRVGRRDISNADLVRQAFTREPPEPGRPRLRIARDDGSETYRSTQDGAMQFAAGCFLAIRNTGAAHTLGDEPVEHEALEQLAAFSIIARWIEAAELSE